MIITKDLLDKKVPINMFPTRLDSAMNLYSNIENKEHSGLIVYNVNPTTWNCLYPFFELNHKFTIDNYNFSKTDITFRALIEEYKIKYKEIYEEKNGFTKSKRIKILIEEYINTFNLQNATIGDELDSFFELKYSKSKNVWTLYYFENYVVKEIKDINILLNQKLYQQEFMPLNENITEINGIEVTSNISYLLSSKSNIEKLEKNKIIDNH